MKMIIRKILAIYFVFLFVLLNCSLVYADGSRPISSDVKINGTDTSIILTEGITTDVVVTATVTDADGCDNITGVSVKFFRTDLTSTGTDDANHRYTQAATLVGGPCTGSSTNYTATIAVEYYADPTDAGSDNEATTWSAEVTPTDGLGGTAGENDTIEMATLTALNVTAAIDYGPLALGADTGTGDGTTTVTNTGNKSIGVQVDGYGASDSDGKSMICTFGSILLANEKYSKTASTAYASKTALTDTATTVVDFSIAQRTDGAITGDIYWGFGMPANGVGGSCIGTVVFTPLPL